ncbi:SDR family NAD(P)-dependent oxidoreductase [Streptomyces sp. AV19]|nr:SDR family NAD(P)-dependent oxidoreductase [Streptomyces sp. AV19]
MAGLFTWGVQVDWEGVLGRGTALAGQFDLPTYAFERERFWLDAGRRQLSQDGAVGSGAGAWERVLWDAVERGDAVGVGELLGVGEGASLGAVVPALGVWWRRCRVRGVVDGWRFREVWERVSGGGWGSGVLSGTWVVVVPCVGSGVGVGVGVVVEGLEGAGAWVVCVEVEVGGGGVDGGLLVERLRGAVGDVGEVGGVVLLLGVGELVGVGDVGGWPGVVLLGVVQGLVEWGVGVGAGLWCVTGGAVSVGVGDGVVCAGLGQVWGLGRVVGLEVPEVWGGLVDVPGVVDGCVVEGLVGVLGGGEPECAVRGSGVFVRRVVPDPLGGTGSGEGEWTCDGTALITGNDDGQDQPAAHAARWLAARGTRHVVLVNGSGDGFGMQDELMSLGVGVSVVACDVVDRGAVGGLLGLVPVGLPLRVVVHAAGVLDDGVVGSLSGERLGVVRGVKAVGAWNVHELVRGVEGLSAFVVFSSAAGAWGSPGQGSYAAANAEVDALVAWRRGVGLPGLSVGWGAWAGGGMAGDAEAVGQLRRRGMAAMDPELALEALGQALAHGDTCVTIADIDWQRFTENAGGFGTNPVFAGIPEVRASLDAARRSPQAGVRDRFAALDRAARATELLELVRSHAAAVLGHNSADRVRPDRAFRDLGFSSLTAVELRNRLSALTGLRLPTTLVFDYPSSVLLAGYLSERMFGSDDRASFSRPSIVRSVVGTDEPIALVGMACRFPGGVRSPEEFWELLAAGRDAVSSSPADRGWDAARLSASPPVESDPSTDPEGCRRLSSVCMGGFLYDAADFDAGFFGISPREALAMDPQQRLMLEVSWEALEGAGIVPAELRGSETGVFAGIAHQDYVDLMRHGSEDLEGYAVTGVSGSVLSGRVSYTFGFEGPAVTVDTACSSSLVALHLACQSLRAGECSLALAGGVTVMSTPGVFVEFSRQRGLAVDGRCKAYAASADGTGMSEGVGMLLVERLSDARRNGHRVLAVVRGSAVNQDGASNGLTAPNGPSQQRVIRQALANARLDVADVDVVEGHGTGTVLGDPIEAQALLATYGRGRSEGRPLWLGSVKSNIGHTQAAAGVAGVIKMVLAMRHGVLPRTLHVDEPSPHVDWASGAVRLLSSEMPWPQPNLAGGPRRAGISSFGVSGTNAHIIIEQATTNESELEKDGPDADHVSACAGSAPAPSSVPWVVSARCESALREQARRLRSFATGAGDALDAEAVGRALVRERSVFEHRAVVLGEDRESLLRGLGALAAGTATPELVEGPPAHAGPGKIAMLFGGQGTQWDGMARELLDSSPVFAGRLEDCARALAPHIDWSLSDVLRGEPGAPPLDRVDVVQPVLFSVMVALAALWESYGLRPDAVAGHSQGEIAAACVAGALSLEDAARVAALRSRALEALAGAGAMVSVGMPAAELEPLLAGEDDRLSIAAVNGARSVVVSGVPEAADSLVARLAADGVPVRRLGVDWASHSPQVESVREDLLRLLEPIRPRVGEVPLYSSVTGALMDGSELDAEYWYRNLRQVVRFDEATRALADDGHRVFVEAGPHPAVLVGVQETLDALGITDAAVVGSLRRGEGGMDRFLQSVARVFVSGAAIDWFPGARPTSVRGAIELPTYAFERERFWLDSPAEHPAASPVDHRDAAGTEVLWDAVERGDAVGVGELLGVGEGASLGAVVPALGVWWRRCRVRGVVDGWRFREVWERVSGGGWGSGVLSGTWVVVVPCVGSGVGVGVGVVVEGLEGAGAWVVCVEVEVGGGGVDGGLLVERLRGAVGDVGEVGGVVLLLGVGELVGVGDVGGWPGVVLLGVVQGLVEWGVGVGAGLWCVTGGAVSVGVGDGVVCAGLGQVWGLGRVVGLEVPEVWGGLVDVPGVVDGCVVEGLVGVLGGGEPECAVRGSGVFVRRVVPDPLGGTGSGEGEWTCDGTALITGNDDGQDQPAAHAARWLAARGTRHVVLVNGSGDGFGMQDELMSLGVGVSVVACDVVDRGAVGGLLGLVPVGLPLRVVVHAAGVLDDGVVGSLSGERLGVVRGVKAVGAWNVHELVRGVEGLSAFVVFSSAAGAWGSPGQGSYAAANAEVDALVAWRRGVGLPGLSVGWGAWAGGGMAGDAEAVGQLRRRGMAAMDPELALEALGQALAHGDTCVTIADIDWQRFTENAGATGISPVFSRIPGVRALRDAEGDRTPQGELRDRLAALDSASRAAALRELVRTHAAAVLGHGSPSAIPPEQAFRDLGFSSLTAVELRNRLSTLSGLRLPTTLVFDHPNASLLAAHLRERMFGDSTSSPRPPVAQLTAGSDEPIALVGMACRYPGDVRSPEEFWSLLAEGRDAVSGFPTDRGWDLELLAEGLAAADASTATGEPGEASSAEGGGFLYDAADFDAGFFGISPREALAMDPQQRLMLEVSWEALESAGIDPHTLRGSDTGVFAGMSQQDYVDLVRHGSEDLEGYAMTGVSGSVLSGRISYTYGFEGPAVTVDTACSSSLVALHLACQSLRSGECSLALVGGATVLSTPGAFVEFSRQRGLAVDGRCKAFAAGADGVGWGEGVGVVLVERLSDARRNGHRVLAVVRGSAVNQDGASNGLTAPNGPSQQRVIRQALANARLDVADVDVVEGHGTGTVLGDPIEAQALLATYGRGRSEGRPLWLGSVKSNIGHTQAAAGVAGVIKMVLAMRHGVLPRTLHVDEPSPHVDWASGAVRLLSSEMPWPQPNLAGGPRRAGISSFGVSGTNAHIIIEQAPEAETELEPEKAPAPEEGTEPAQRREKGTSAPASAPVPWIVSARSESALRRQARRLRQFAADDATRDALARNAADRNVTAIARALATDRALFEHRAVVLGDGRAELLRGLDALATGTPAPGIVEGPARATPYLRPALLFAGQGTQRPGMGQELYGTVPAFADALDEAFAALDSHLDRPLRSVVFAAPGTAEAALLDRPGYAQTGLFALEVALFRLVEALGVRPEYLIGHSVGELAAAHVAGVLSLADAALLVAARGSLMEALPPGGAMTAIRASEGEVARALATDEAAERVSVAAVNGPRSVVVSGAAEAVERVAEGFAARGCKTRRLRVGHAFHSPLMEPMLEEFRRTANAVSYAEPTLGIVSCLTGRPVTPGLLTDPEYWVRHVRETVRFAAGMEWLRAEGADAFVELGPDGTLSALTQESVGTPGTADADFDAGPDLDVETVAESGPAPAPAPVPFTGDAPAEAPGPVLAVPLLRPDRAEPRTFLAALAQVHVNGGTIDWPAVIGPRASTRAVELPTYAFDHRRYWLDPRPAGSDVTAAGLDSSGHPLLGAAVELAESQGLLFTGRLSLRTHPWLSDHVVFGVVLLPGTAMLELAVRAAQETALGTVEELTLQVPLALPERGAVVLQLAVDAPGPSGERSFSLHSHPDDEHGNDRRDGPMTLAAGKAWTCHATGVLTPDVLSGPGRQDDRWVAPDAPWPPPDAEPVDLDGWYADLASAGLGYGPAFQGLRAAWRRAGDIYAEVALDEEQTEQAARYAVHPALLDAALHPVVLGVDMTEDRERDGGLLPFSWSGVSVTTTGAPALRVRLTPTSRETIALEATDGAGRPVLSARALTFRPISEEQLRAARTTYHESLFRMEWKPRPVPTAHGGDSSVSRCRWAVVGSAVHGMREALDAAGAAWQPYPDLAALGEAVASGAPAPDMTVVSCGAEEATGEGDRGEDTAGNGTGQSAGGEVVPVPAVAVQEAAGHALSLLQGWLADDRFADSRLAVVTRGAVAADGEDTVSGLAHAAVWGLVRSAQSENPGRFVLADTDGSRPSRQALPDALLTGEPQFALRSGTARTPLLNRVAVTRAPAPGTGAEAGAGAGAASGDGTGWVDGAGTPVRWDPETTVLITGGTGVLGRIVARHLVTAHGIRHLLLAGRRGVAAAGATELVAELAAHGADVTVHACDTADREAVARLLAQVPDRHPLGAVIHMAGVVDDGIVTSLTAARMAAVLGAKAIGALHLHELTRAFAPGLRDFLVFSSAGASFGSPGQGNYTAANAFLDALMHHRRAQGLPGQSLAWGLWAEASGMTGHLDATDLARMSRGGLAPLSNEQGLALVDAAGAVDEPLLLATRLDMRALHAQAAAGALPRILQGLVRVPARRAGGDGGDADAAAALRRRLDRAAGPGERTRIIQELVRAQAALVLGHGTAEQVPADTEFRELGFDSLTAVELRNRLNSLTGLRLATTLVFDHPTPEALARHLEEAMAEEDGAGAARGPTKGTTGHAEEDNAEGARANSGGSGAFGDPDDQDRRNERAGDDRDGDGGHDRGDGGESEARRKYGPKGQRGGPPEATVESLFWLGHDTGRVKESMDLLSAASVFRPSFDRVTPETAPQFVRLAQGDPAGGRPVLICLPTVAAVSSAYQYVRFAAALEGLRDVWYLPAPGFVAGEPLPADVDVLIRTFAEAVVDFMGEAPFVLAGHSAGGWITYAVTRHLEGRGVFPRAVVAMDAWLPDEGMAPVASALTSEIFDRVTQFLDVDYARLTAMGGYFRIFSGWTPPDIVTPALFVRGQDGEQKPPVWGVPHTVAEIRGDHFTMLESHAEETARYIHGWIAQFDEER